MATNADENLTLDAIENRFMKCLNSPQLTKRILEAVKPAFDELFHTIMRNSKTIRTQENRIEQLEKKVNNYEKELSTITNKMETKAKNEKLLTLRVTGLPQDASEAEEEFKKIAAERMAVKIDTPKDIEVRTQLLRRTQPVKKVQDNDQQDNNKQDNDNPPNEKYITIIKFNNIWQRRLVYDARMKLKGTGIFLNEDLNGTEQHLMYLCRQKKKEGKIKAVWTKELKILCKMNDDTIKEINHINEIDQQLDRSNTSIYSSTTSFHGFNLDEISQAELRYNNLIREISQITN